MTNEVLRSLSSTFDAMYSKTGRPSTPPERLLKSQILMALYSVRSDRQFCEQLDYNLLFRWFLVMSADEPTFDASSFSRIINLIGNTTNRGGLVVRARLDRRNYPTGKKVSARELRELNIERHKFHGDWNYVIKPY